MLAKPNFAVYCSTAFMHWKPALTIGKRGSHIGLCSGRVRNWFHAQAIIASSERGTFLGSDGYTMCQFGI